MWRWLARGKDGDELVQPRDGRQCQIARASVRVATGKCSARPRDDLLDDAAIAAGWQNAHTVADGNRIVLVHGDTFNLASRASP
jgi:hypothetical protein